ncbi:MAG TPA: hypothetical protein VFC18_20000 [Burkholderiales bacterium]|nr:hypothetical protein [Burkholderiales bacterium]
MRLARTFALSVFLAAAMPAAAAPQDHERVLGHMLTLVQSVVRIAAHADTPRDSARAFDEVLAGKNADVNRAVMGLFDEMTADMSDRDRERIASIGRDLAMIGRKEARRPPPDGALQARKDLNAMGLSYYDQSQFFDAVKRNDALAVELFIAGRGVDLAARDAEGRIAAEIARGSGNAELAELLARSRPAGR